MNDKTLERAMAAELTRQLLAIPRGTTVSLESLAAALPAFERTYDGRYTLRGYEGTLTRDGLLRLEGRIIRSIVARRLFVNYWEKLEGPAMFSIHDMVKAGENIDPGQIARMAIAYTTERIFGIEKIVSLRGDTLFDGHLFGNLPRACTRVHLSPEDRRLVGELVSDTRVFDWGGRYSQPPEVLVNDGYNVELVILLEDGRAFASGGSCMPRAFWELFYGLRGLTGQDVGWRNSGYADFRVTRARGRKSSLLQHATLLEDCGIDRDAFEDPHGIVCNSARTICRVQHEGQIDKGGESYYLHPFRVAARAEGGFEEEAAYLHDVVEDTEMTLEGLRRWHIPPEVIEAVDCLTRRDGEDYFDYVRRAGSNEIARKVKLADLEDNLDPGRPGATEAMRERYWKAREMLLEGRE